MKGHILRYPKCTHHVSIFQPQVQFLFDCLMGLKDFNGCGCILADDMGLGKTLQLLGGVNWGSMFKNNGGL